MTKKMILLISSFAFFLIFGVISGLLFGKVQSRILDIIYAVGTIIIFLTWLNFDSDEYDYPISKLFKLLIIFLGVPVFWYIFKTRKLKKGLLFILKSLGIIILLFTSFAVPHLIILSLRGIDI